jgi:hypothetical protein
MSDVFEDKSSIPDSDLLDKDHHVHTWFDPPYVPGEVNSGEVVVERNGYIPAFAEIQELIKAGERLDEARGTYEFSADEEVPEDYIDPYRAPDADIVDFDRVVGTLAFMMKKQRDEKQKADDAAAAAAKKENDSLVADGKKFREAKPTEAKPPEVK